MSSTACLTTATGALEAPSSIFASSLSQALCSSRLISHNLVAISPSRHLAIASSITAPGLAPQTQPEGGLPTETVPQIAVCKAVQTAADKDAGPGAAERYNRLP